MAGGLDPKIDWIKKPTGFLKVVNMIVAFVCLTLWLVAPSDGARGIGFHASNLCLITASSTAMILMYILIAYILDNADGALRTTEIIFDFVHTVLSIASGALIFERNHGVATGIIYIALAILLIVDGIFDFKDR